MKIFGKSWLRYLLMLASALIWVPAALPTAVSADVSTVTVSSADGATAAEYGPTPGIFTFTRSGGDLSSPLTVNFSMGGDAKKDTDYRMWENSAHFEAGSTKAYVSILPINASSPKTDQTATLTVTSGTGYTVGSPSSANVTIKAYYVPGYPGVWDWNDVNPATGLSVVTPDLTYLDATVNATQLDVTVCLQSSSLLNTVQVWLDTDQNPKTGDYRQGHVAGMEYRVQINADFTGGYQLFKLPTAPPGDQDVAVGGLGTATLNGNCSTAYVPLNTIGNPTAVDLFAMSQDSAVGTTNTATTPGVGNRLPEYGVFDTSSRTVVVRNPGTTQLATVTNPTIDTKVNGFPLSQVTFRSIADQFSISLSYNKYFDPTDAAHFPGPQGNIVVDGDRSIQTGAWFMGDQIPTWGGDMNLSYSINSMLAPGIVIVLQNDPSGSGEAFGQDANDGRWLVQGSYSSNQSVLFLSGSLSLFDAERSGISGNNSIQVKRQPADGRMYLQTWTEDPAHPTVKAYSLPGPKSVVDTSTGQVLQPYAWDTGSPSYTSVQDNDGDAQPGVSGVDLTQIESQVLQGNLVIKGTLASWLNTDYGNIFKIWLDTDMNSSTHVVGTMCNPPSNTVNCIGADYGFYMESIDIGGGVVYDGRMYFPDGTHTSNQAMLLAQPSSIVGQPGSFTVTLPLSALGNPGSQARLFISLGNTVVDLIDVSPQTPMVLTLGNTPLWSVTLSAARSLAPTGYWVSFTAQANRDVSNSGYAVVIFDADTNSIQWTCSTGSTCTFSHVDSRSITAHFVARIAHSDGTAVQATSNTWSVSWYNDWSVTLSASQSSVTSGASVTLTAQANHDLSPSWFALQILDADTQAVLYSCTSGTTCNTSVSSASASTHNYVARVARPDGSWVQTTSNPVSVTWTAPWGVTLSASQSSASTGVHVTFTAQANRDVANSGYAILVVNTDTNTINQTCSTGTTCQASLTGTATRTSQYAAQIAHADGTAVQATSSTVPVTWTDDWTDSLTSPQTSLPAGASATLTAQTNHDVTGTDFSILLLDGDTNEILKQCTGGTSCALDVSSSIVATHHYISRIAEVDGTQIQVTSSTVSITWVAPTAQLDKTSIDFGNQPINTSSDPRDITLSNPGSAPLAISSIDISGDFSQTNDCGSSLASNAGCTIHVTFKPTATGSRSGTLSVSDNASDSPQKVALSGTGTAAAVKLDQSKLDFGNQTVNTASASQSVTLTNSGTAPLTITGVSLGGTNAGDFSETTSCTGSVAPGDSCVTTVTFTPADTGYRTATLTFADSAADSPQSVALSGTGTPKPVPAVKLDPTRLDFGSQLVRTTSPSRLVTLTNSGNAPLSISSISASGDFGQSNTCGSSLDAGAKCTISVSFTPGSAGSRSGALSIADNAMDSPQTVILSGTGTVPPPPHSSVYKAVSTSQYLVPGGSVRSWRDIDPARLNLTITPAADSTVVLTGNADLVSSRAGFHQDLAISVNGQPVTWKESTEPTPYAPRDTVAHAVVSFKKGFTYTVRLQWKTDGPDIGTGEGPGRKDVSPTWLTAEVIPNGSATTVSTAATTQRYVLAGSDGKTWKDLDGLARLTLHITPVTDSTAILSGNADLFSSSAGYSQDLGINVNGQTVAWKESASPLPNGPNDTFVHAAIPLKKGVSYTVKLQWKASRPDPGTIWAGAGPLGGKYSPTWLTAEVIPAGSATTVSTVSSNGRYALTGSDGKTWKDVDSASKLTLRITPAADSTAILSGSADLATSATGYNPDLGVFISGGSYGSGQMVSWKEDGGLAPSSFNGAFVHAIISLQKGVIYTIKLQWKASKPGPSSIVTGASPVPTGYSPTSLTALVVP